MGFLKSKQVLHFYASNKVKYRYNVIQISHQPFINDIKIALPCSDVDEVSAVPLAARGSKWILGEMSPLLPLVPLPASSEPAGALSPPYLSEVVGSKLCANLQEVGLSLVSCPHVLTQPASGYHVGWWHVRDDPGL